MMFQQLTPLLFIAFSFFSFAQESKLITKGAEMFSNGDYKGALKSFNKESEQNNSARVKFWIASCYFKMEKFEVAKKGFLEIVRRGILDEEQEMSLTNLGSCYRELNQIDSAFYYYDQAIDEFPASADAYFNKGQLLYFQSRFNEAKDVFTAAISIDSTDWLYYIKRQEISFILNEYDDALNDMLKAQKLNPKLNISVNIAYCYSMLGRYREADLIYKQIYDEKDFIILNNYGLIKHKLGNSKEGEEMIWKSLKLNPGNSYAYRNLAIIAIDSDDIVKACTYLKKAKELNFSSDHGAEVDNLLLKHCN